MAEGTGCLWAGGKSLAYKLKKKKEGAKEIECRKEENQSNIFEQATGGEIWDSKWKDWPLLEWTVHPL